MYSLHLRFWLQNHTVSCECLTFYHLLVGSTSMACIMGYGVGAAYHARACPMRPWFGRRRDTSISDAFGPWRSDWSWRTLCTSFRKADSLSICRLVGFFNHRSKLPLLFSHVGSLAFERRHDYAGKEKPTASRPDETRKGSLLSTSLKYAAMAGIGPKWLEPKWLEPKWLRSTCFYKTA